MWSVHTTEYYSALQAKEILTYAIAWMNFENIMLNETSQSQKDRYCTIHLYEVPRVSQMHRESASGCKGLGGEVIGKLLLMGIEPQFCKMRKMVVMVAQCECTQCR